MRQYQTKAELIQTIQDTFQKYITEFEEIPEEWRHQHHDKVDKSPSENLSYQLGWLHLLLDWEAQEKNGVAVQTPAAGYKWNQLGALYDQFYQRYGQLSLKEQQQQLTQLVEELCQWISTLSDTELFEPGQRKWATTKAQWPLYKWIHINSVAPFTNFRTKIRKWKRLVMA
ncbi:ClbS/DfsB family four-helix bundle protein [Enterococcus gallinarum]|uniref:ClbS/DfsB family four-helix bundle protein n=1 Tax=Enterococcus gallinarum TaxID=1353 RepID=A0AAE4HVE2_ENTGA|nr:ClbS/DfsB family four-helix bundle protein [Enterococcus gallinarum]MDT2687981.1 ClbS/DfsB family four-helix bundle protein [Enterococcus gallinarum]MDT2691877.1 ClbS/DfsB family four-helix bundle protein [Enterococcus gallinarum]